MSIPTFSASLDITRKCNLRCRHCFNYSGDSYIHEELSDEFLLSLPEQFRGLPVESLCLCGGEPLLRYQLIPSLIQKFKKVGIMDVNLTTNGILVTREIAKELKNAGVGNVQVSLDGEKDEHNWLRNNDCAYDGAIRAIKYLLEEGINVSVACTPTRKNIDSIVEEMDRLNLMGVSMFRMQPIMFLGRAKGITDYYLSASEYTVFSMKLAKTIKEKQYGMVVEWGDPTMHLYYLAEGKDSKLVSINTYGEILLSPYLPISFGNVKKHTFKEYIDHGLRSICSESEILRDVFKKFGCVITNQNSNTGYPELYKDDIEEKMKLLVVNR